MLHVHELDEIQLEKSWVTIGSFDGVHLGHQKIIRKLVRGARAASQPGVVITFFPHPQLVIGGESRPFYLTLPENRARILQELGLDVVLTYPFTRKTSRETAREFIFRLHNQLHFNKLLVGYDFALGKNREGNCQVLRQIGAELGYSVEEVSPVEVDGELVSSSRIRGLLREGKVGRAAELLGRNFDLSGTVISGDDRGKSLGFATSNLQVHPELVAIRGGVYACWAAVEGQILPAVTNIGVRPTFGDDLDVPRIEAHLLDFSGDLYGQKIRLSFVERLRDEKKFNQVSGLIAQIKADVARARQMLSPE